MIFSLRPMKNGTIGSSSIPSMANIMKECDASISTGLTLNKTENSSSRVGSTVHVRMLKKESPMLTICWQGKYLKYKSNKPIHSLSDIKTDAVVHVVTKKLSYMLICCTTWPIWQHFWSLQKLVTDDQIKERIELNDGLHYITSNGHHHIYFENCKLDTDINH